MKIASAFARGGAGEHQIQKPGEAEMVGCVGRSVGIFAPLYPQTPSEGLERFDAELVRDVAETRQLGLVRTVLMKSQFHEMFFHQ